MPVRRRGRLITRSVAAKSSALRACARCHWMPPTADIWRREPLDTSQVRAGPAHHQTEHTVTPTRRLEAGEGIGLRVLNVEELVEPGDREDLINFRLEIAHLHLARVGLGLFVENDQLVEGRRGEEFDVVEVEQNVLALFLLDQRKELIP